ncbi:ATP-dependent DNA helicase 2 subunit KU70 [Cocos nucifera]|uniref:ATP-dependent DNA helicase 2 subunit KU70 n=1 Tax=Cocos nucifera TaxID=13894 RepID=A0A8K0NDK6_COCNU|nr:ATP-dependent DNA helicase 2 subunit KU70 [Cocos nucifera]
MDLDPQGLFRDDSDSESEFYQEKDSTKEFVVYLVDASPKMFGAARSDKEKKNLQDLNGVYVFNVTDRECLDRPTARLIKEFSYVEDKFMSNIGSRYGIASGSQENSLYNALWVAQALLRKGSSKSVSKRILLFTNEDDPFGSITGATKTDMIRMTLQRAKSHGVGYESICISKGIVIGIAGVAWIGSEIIKFSTDELSEIKKVSNGQLHLLGFKPLDCLKDYHNLRPSTFIFPTDEIKLHQDHMKTSGERSSGTLELIPKFALAFYGSLYRPQLVALVAQLHMSADAIAPRATDDQIKKASALLRRIDLKDFSVCQFANPALQRHYGILQALALGEDEMPDIKDETLPDEEGLSRTGIVHALEEFKISVYGENYDQEEANSAATKGSGSEASRKRKAMAETAAREGASYDWADLAENGKLKDLTVVELKYYLTAHNLPVTGKKEALISRILTHLGK